jgi:LCP family protein required for cell wall assembly
MFRYLKFLIFILLITACSVPTADTLPTLTATLYQYEAERTELAPTATSTPIPTVTPTPTSTPWVYPTAIYDDAIPQNPLLEPVRPAWKDDVKVYVLLGSDYASWRINLETGTDNTDAFIILIVKEEPATISVINVPRDLYVFLPGHGMQRINTAYKIGGDAMVADVLRYNFGLPFNGLGYVRMEAFIRFIDDALHGVTVNVRNPVIDTCSNITINVLPGEHFMDGKTALCYARVRMFDGGFKRQSRQVEVLEGMKNKFLETIKDKPVQTALDLLTLYVNEHRYTTVGLVEAARLVPVLREANKKGRIFEYQITPDLAGVESFTHPETGAWLLAYPSCMSDMMYRAVLSEPWETLPARCLAE